MHINCDPYESSSYAMLIDKLVMLSSSAICGKIKDFYDIYATSLSEDLDMDTIVKEFVKHRGLASLPELGLYFTNKDSVVEMSHAYEKFEDISNKLAFSEIYAAVSSFTLPIFAGIYSGASECGKWLKDAQVWEKMWLSQSTMRSGKLFSGIICLESASYLNRLSNFPPIKMQIWTDTIPIKNSVLTFVKTNKISFEDTELVAQNLFITDKGRTICEMMESGVTEEFICQSLESYLNDHTKEELSFYVNKYTSQEKYNYYLTLYDEYLRGEF